MTQKNVVNIKGRDYVTVAGRIEAAHEACKKLDILTDVVSTDPIVFKATVILQRADSESIETYTGYSAANPAKLIEKESPYEVAESSAVGRALGFAGFGSVESLASADEVEVAVRPNKITTANDALEAYHDEKYAGGGTCAVCKHAITKKVMDYSVSKYGKPLCFDHQKTDASDIPYS